jgi:hypothetical protein
MDRERADGASLSIGRVADRRASDLPHAAAEVAAPAATGLSSDLHRECGFANLHSTQYSTDLHE